MQTKSKTTKPVATVGTIAKKRPTFTEYRSFANGRKADILATFAATSRVIYEDTGEKEDVKQTKVLTVLIPEDESVYALKSAPWSLCIIKQQFTYDHVEVEFLADASRKEISMGMLTEVFDPTELCTGRRYNEALQHARKFLVPMLSGDGRFTDRHINFLALEGAIFGWITAQDWFNSRVEFCDRHYPREDHSMVVRDFALQVAVDAADGHSKVFKIEQ
jgi:hypothetical protein